MVTVTKYKASNILLRSRPYALGPGVWAILKSTSDFLFCSKNRNASLYNCYVAPLLSFFKTKDLNSICWFSCPVSDLQNPYPLNLNVIATRILITSLFQKFIYRCWKGHSSDTPEETRKFARHYSRMMECSPVGFQDRMRACKDVLCPNCHLRKAINYRKRMMEAESENNSAIVIKLEIPFDENLMLGSYFPVFPKAATTGREYPLMDIVRRALKPKGKVALGKAAGITVADRHPSTCVCLHALCNEQDLDFKYRRAEKLANELMKKQKEYKTKVTVLKCPPNSKNNLLDINTLTFLMYDNAPIRLLATSINGFTASNQDIFLETTIKDFCEQNKNKKLNIIRDV